MKKQLWLPILFFCCSVSPLFAQPGLDEMSQAQQSLSSTFFSAMNFALVLATVFGIIGAARIYHNWQMGHPRIDQQVASWFFAAFFMVLAGNFLQAVFGL